MVKDTFMFLMYSTLHIKKDNLHYTYFVAKSIRHNIITDIESLHSEMLHEKKKLPRHRYNPEGRIENP